MCELDGGVDRRAHMKRSAKLIMKGFLKQFKEGPKGEVVYAPLEKGFLRLSYEGNGRIYQAAFVKERGADPGGRSVRRSRW